MLLENEIGALRTEEAYPLTSGDWGPLIRGGDCGQARGSCRAADRGAVSQCAGRTGSWKSPLTRRTETGRAQRRSFSEPLSDGTRGGCARVPRLRGAHAPAGSAERWRHRAGASGDEQDCSAAESTALSRGRIAGSRRLQQRCVIDRRGAEWKSGPLGPRQSEGLSGALAPEVAGGQVYVSRSSRQGG